MLLGKRFVGGFYAILLVENKARLSSLAVYVGFPKDNPEISDSRSITFRNLVLGPML